MKRTYLARRNALLSGARLSWGAAFLVLAILMLVLRLIMPGAFSVLTAPAFSLSQAIAERSDSFFSSFRNASELSARNDDLTKENLALAAENQELLQQVGDVTGLFSGAKSPAPGILAGVIARPPESPYDVLLVGAGSGGGVTAGMEAFGAGDSPLGIVSAVTNDAARVTLFSSPGTATAGWIGKSKTPLTLHGAGAGSFSASASRAAAIAVGDVVYLPGPGALPAGSVVRIDSDPSSPSVELRIQPALNIFSTTWVELRDVGRAQEAVSSATSLPL